MEAFAILCGILVVGYIVGYYGWRIWKSKQNQPEYDFMNSVLKHAPQSIQETFRTFQHNNGRLGKSPSIDPAVPELLWVRLLPQTIIGRMPMLQQQSLILKQDPSMQSKCSFLITSTH